VPFRWQRPPALDEAGRLAPEVRARARRRVLRALGGLVLAAIAAGLLAYACSAGRTSAHSAKHSSGRTLPACLRPTCTQAPLGLVSAESAPMNPQ
jgi:hypothetical protein